MDITYHVNPAQRHQVEHGQWLRDGLKRHGIDLTISSDINREADIHIVSGPHYAKARWLGHRTLLLDRAYYHDGKSGRWASMDWVSLGWMNADGGRRFTAGAGRKSPDRKAGVNRSGSIFLADFDGPVGEADTVRLHPARERPGEPLLDALRRHGVAIGYQTTALVRAALEGLDTVCLDSRNILAQPDWYELLPYADWEASEISSGEAWEHLKHDIHTGDCADR